MVKRRQNNSITPVEIVAIITILGALVAFFINYPTVHPIVHGSTNEVAPLELINVQQSYFQFRNDGAISIIIVVNYSSDGSIHFKNDKGDILDSSEVKYVVNPKTEQYFRFNPIINDSINNATLFVNYRSYIESFPGLEPRQPKQYWLFVYEKSVEQTSVKWELRQSKTLPI